MATQYIVVQYGDLMTGEFLNIGVIAWDMDDSITEVKSKFLTNLDRIKFAFNYADPIMEDLLENWLKKIAVKSEVQFLIESCNSPYTSLQITAPRGSIESVDELIIGVAKTFLKE